MERRALRHPRSGRHRRASPVRAPAPAPVAACFAPARLRRGTQQVRGERPYDRRPAGRAVPAARRRAGNRGHAHAPFQVTVRVTHAASPRARFAPARRARASRRHRSPDRAAVRDVLKARRAPGLPRRLAALAARGSRPPARRAHAHQGATRQGRAHARPRDGGRAGRRCRPRHRQALRRLRAAGGGTAHEHHALGRHADRGDPHQLGRHRLRQDRRRGAAQGRCVPLPEARHVEGPPCLHRRGELYAWRHAGWRCLGPHAAPAHRRLSPRPRGDRRLPSRQHAQGRSHPGRHDRRGRDQGRHAQRHVLLHVSDHARPARKHPRALRPSARRHDERRRVDRVSVPIDLEVQVRRDGKASRPRLADHLAARNALPLGDGAALQMRIARFEPVLVRDDDDVAEFAHPCGLGDASGGRGVDGLPQGHREIGTGVHPVDLEHGVLLDPEAGGHGASRRPMEGEAAREVAGLGAGGPREAGKY